MTTEPLQHLADVCASAGAWMLRVSTVPQDVDYNWNGNGKSGIGRRLERVSVSENCNQYCQGMYKRRGTEPQATKDFEAAKDKSQKGTRWKECEVSLVEDNPKYLGCSCKVVIDMSTSTFQPVLQGTVRMQKQAELRSLAAIPQRSNSGCARTCRGSQPTSPENDSIWNAQSRGHRNRGRLRRERGRKV